MAHSESPAGEPDEPDPIEAALAEDDTEPEPRRRCGLSAKERKILELVVNLAIIAVLLLILILLTYLVAASRGAYP